MGFRGERENSELLRDRQRELFLKSRTTLVLGSFRFKNASQAQTGPNTPVPLPKTIDRKVAPADRKGSVDNMGRDMARTGQYTLVPVPFCNDLVKCVPAK